MLSTHLLLQAVLATAVSANLKKLLIHRQSDSCVGSISDQVCYDPDTTLADCRDAICADPCYFDVPGIQQCCNTSTTDEFSDCLNAQIDGSYSYAPTYTPTGTPTRNTVFGASSSIPRYVTPVSSATQPASITAAPTAGTGSSSDGCAIVGSAANACSSAINGFDNLPLFSQASCYCSVAGPDVFDSAFDGCLRTGSIQVPSASALITIASTFCFEVGAAATPTGFGGGAGVPTTTGFTAIQTPSSFTPAEVATSQRVLVSTVVVGSTPSGRTTTAARSTTQAVPGGFQTATGGAPMGVAPAGFLSVLTAMVLAVLGA